MKKPWALSEAAFNKLLECLDPDRQLAAEKYEKLHLRLRKFFEVHRGALAEELADETINRVARKIEEGVRIEKPVNYTLKVAGFLLKESVKKEGKKEELHDMPSAVPDEPEGPAEMEARLACLDRCMAKHPAETQTLMLEYYQFRKHDKIANRKSLAEKFGIPVNALRIRIHRIRAQLEQCVIDCMASAGRDDMD